MNAFSFFNRIIFQTFNTIIFSSDYKQLTGLRFLTRLLIGIVCDNTTTIKTDINKALGNRLVAVRILKLYILDFNKHTYIFAMAIIQCDLYKK